MMADTVARTVVAPAEIPVGVDNRVDRRPFLSLSLGHSQISIYHMSHLCRQKRCLLIIRRLMCATSRFSMTSAWGHHTGDHSGWVINGMEFIVRQGEMLGVIGPNGSGKSSLLKLLTKLVQTSRGKHPVIRGRSWGIVP